MNDNDFEKFLKQAVNMCYDYDTKTPESKEIAMLWFTPSQLKKYTNYCINASKQKKDKKEAEN